MKPIVAQALPEILGRDRSFLHEEISSTRSQISEALSGASVLVIGAAGSIGGAFASELASYSMKRMHLVDISENNLAEVVRVFRSAGLTLPLDFQTFAIDFTGPEMRALLNKYSYDFVLNFSALKHVRSERDPFTLMRLLEVNVLGNDILVDTLSRQGTPQMLFSVSSDKAVRPANLMGASKAFMERVLLSRADQVPFGSARFANVAFSDGSLLYSFLSRLENRQPLSAPRDVRRYFISHEEAGQLCLLGAFSGGNREIFFPKFQPEEDMMTFSEIACVLLDVSGYKPVECESEEEALKQASKLNSSSKEWPCYFSDSDTTGEKPFEEFHDPREEVDLKRFPEVGVVTSPIESDSLLIRESIEDINSMRKKGSWEKEELLAAVQKVVPELNHSEMGKNLDQKM